MAYKMKGSPMKRNFGVGGSPMTQKKDIKPKLVNRPEVPSEDKESPMDYSKKSPMKQGLNTPWDPTSGLSKEEWEHKQREDNQAMIDRIQETQEMREIEQFKRMKKEGLKKYRRGVEEGIKEGMGEGASPMKQWYRDAWDEATQLGVGLKEFGKELGSYGSGYGYQGRITKNPVMAFREGYRAEEARDAEAKDDWKAVDEDDALWALTWKHGNLSDVESDKDLKSKYKDMSPKEKIKAYIRKEKAGEIDPGGYFHKTRNIYK